MYAIRWNTRRNGPVFLASLDQYGRGEQIGQAFVTDINDALTFDSVKDALAAVQERALNIDDVNSKLEIVHVTGGRLQVGDIVS